MKYPSLALLCVLLWPCAAGAVEAPAGQIRLDAAHVLRGHFVDERQIAGMDKPMRTTGSFVAAPARGLIWGIEKPFPTSTVVTPDGAFQALGNISLKLPAKNLHHLYEMLGGALAGDWSGLEQDFTITPSGSGGHWQMRMTPRHPENAKLPYAMITVSGGSFVENILMAKGDGSIDALHFSDEVLSPAPPTAGETALFDQVKH